MSYEEYELVLRELQEDGKKTNKIILLIVLVTFLSVGVVLFFKNISTKLILTLLVLITFNLILIIIILVERARREDRLESYNNEFLGLSYKQLVQIKEEIKNAYEDWGYLMNNEQYKKIMIHLDYANSKETKIKLEKVK